MGNIFGYIGTENAKEILLSGISLFSTSQDMAGIVLKEDKGFANFKIKGSPEELASKAANPESKSSIGLAQCSEGYRRPASSITAPPASNSLFTAALDGEIENYKELLSQLKSPFPVANDEDLLLALLSVNNEKNKLALSNKISSALSGGAGFAFISAQENAIYCKSGFKKLIIGFSKIGYFVSSELSALIPFCEKYAILEEGEIARLSKEKAMFYDLKLKKLKKALETIFDKRLITAEKNVCDELKYLSAAIKNILARFVDKGGINLDYLKLSNKFLDRTDKIVLLGTGSSLNLALSSKALFETYFSLTAEAQSPAEFLSSYSPIDKYTLVIAISQSGEEREMLRCIQKAEQNGAKTLALTNNPCCALSRECSFDMFVDCEYKTAPLITYLSDYLALCFLALFIGVKIETVSSLYLGVTLKMAEMLPGIISSVLRSASKSESAANLINKSSSIFLCSDCSLEYEAAKIIRKAAEKNAAAARLDELCEYPKALLKGALVFAIISDKNNLVSIKRRLLKIKNNGAQIIIITSESTEDELEEFESIITFPDSLPIFSPLPCLAIIEKISLLAEKLNSEEAQEQSA